MTFALPPWQSRKISCILRSTARPERGIPGNYRKVNKVSIELGSKVRDSISGLEGIATSRTEWLYGCVRVGVTPTELHEGKPVGELGFDEDQLALVKDKVTPAASKTGGSRPSITRASDPSR